MSAKASARWRAAHPEQARESSRRSARKTYHEGGGQAQRRAYLYGITDAEYTKLLIEQGGVCAVCRQPETRRMGPAGGTRPLAVDHDHETGEIRGLLCSRCNAALGFLNDDPALVEAALGYITKTGVTP